MRYLFLKLSLEWSMDDHSKDSKKNPSYTTFDYSSLEFRLKLFHYYSFPWPSIVENQFRRPFLSMGETQNSVSFFIIN
jgi:hypothetical protein